MAYEPKKLTPAELAELHALPDEALLTAQEASAFLRLKYNTLSWYRCNGGGPAFVRVGPADPLPPGRPSRLHEWAADGRRRPACGHGDACSPHRQGGGLTMDATKENARGQGGRKETSEMEVEHAEAHENNLAASPRPQHHHSRTPSSWFAPGTS